MSKGNVRITFNHFQAETYDEYKNVDVKELENSMFYLRQKRTSLAEYVDLKEKLEIIIE